MNSRETNSPYIAIACGGTGGHLFPGLAVARQLQQRGCRVALLISPKDVDQQAVRNAADLEVITLPAVALQSGSRLAFLRGFWKSWRASRKMFKADRPDALLAMGGFTSAPPVLAARALGAKTFLHESNTIPGRANRWLARRVDQAFVGFAQATERLRVREATVTGTPVRSEFTKAHGAAESFGLDSSRPIILVMGGSQGASGVNDLVIAALPLVAQRMPHWQWLHLTGPKDVEKVKAAFTQHGLRASVHPFLAEMNLAMAAATATVSRAGASSLAEIAALRLPALLIPFPAAADNHQLFNAQAFAATGAARVLEQKSATPEKFFELLHGLVEDGATREKMQSALACWHAPKAAEQIADGILAAIPRRAELPTPSAGESAAQKDKSSRALSFGIWALMLLGNLGAGTVS